MINPPTPWEMDTGSFIRLYHDADQLTRDNIVVAMHLKLRDYRKEKRAMSIYRFRRYDDDANLPATTLIAALLLAGWGGLCVGICKFMGWL
jgi:hypothetical protein